MSGNKYEGLSFFENNEFQNLNNEFLKGSMDNNKNEEEKGLIEKAIGLSKKGAENIQKGFKATLEKTNLTNTPSISSNSTAAETESIFSNFPLFNNQNRNNESNTFFGFTALLSYKNFPLFCVLFGVSVLFMILSFLTLPMIVIAPRQFGFFFTLSSISFVSSLAFLKGFSSLYFHLLEKKRLPFTTAYILSLVSTLYFTVISPLYLLALITSIVQVLALISFIVSYIPGGSEAIKMLINALYSYIKKLFRKNNSSDLPF
ncbi:protein transport protein SFT2, putative [Plasmodium gallinaceum]|uniref:Vesicle transport protein n=1 Tax=Plasmodium gallinaceum TaxID=5849 RepID=A0A1J1GRL6_PLAGA|nr:protein transport protein SFT2, putative [Plasmodium gallinaceum]CRG94939.1 protein transport protein SFT2, putative [Plasmodium gallinaceum]